MNPLSALGLGGAGSAKPASGSARAATGATSGRGTDQGSSGGDSISVGDQTNGDQLASALAQADGDGGRGADNDRGAQGNAPQAPVSSSAGQGSAPTAPGGSTAWGAKATAAAQALGTSLSGRSRSNTTSSTSSAGNSPLRSLASDTISTVSNDVVEPVLRSAADLLGSAPAAGRGNHTPSAAPTAPAAAAGNAGPGSAHAGQGGTVAMTPGSTARPTVAPASNLVGLQVGSSGVRLNVGNLLGVKLGTPTTTSPGNPPPPSAAAPGRSTSAPTGGPKENPSSNEGPPRTDAPPQNQPANGSATDGNAANPRAANGDAPQSDAPKGDTPHGDAPTGNALHGDAPTGNAPHGDGPTGNASHGDAPLGNAPHADTPNGSVQHGDASTGNAPHGDAPHGETPNGSIPHGDAPTNSAPHGDGPSGNAPRGDAPTGNASAGDAPHGETPNGNMPHGNAPSGKAPHGDAPSDAAPTSSAPRGDTSNRDVANDRAPNSEPNGNAPSSGAPRGDAANGTVPRGDSPNGDAPKGDQRNERTPNEFAHGDLPNGKAPNGYTPNPPGSRNNAPSGSATSGNAPKTNAPVESATDGESQAVPAPRTSEASAPGRNDSAPVGEAPNGKAPIENVPSSNAANITSPNAATPIVDAPHSDAPTGETARGRAADVAPQNGDGGDGTAAARGVPSASATNATGLAESPHGDMPTLNLPTKSAAPADSQINTIEPKSSPVQPRANELTRAATTVAQPVAAPAPSEAESSVPQLHAPLVDVRVGSDEVNANVAKLVDVELSNGNRTPQNGNGGVSNQPRGNQNAPQGSNSRSTDTPSQQSTSNDSPANEAATMDSAPGERAPVEAVSRAQSGGSRSAPPAETPTPGAASAMTAAAQLGTQNESDQLLRQPRAPQSAVEAESGPSKEANSVIGVHVGNGEVDANVGRLADVKIGNNDGAQNAKTTGANQPASRNANLGTQSANEATEEFSPPPISQAKSTPDAPNATRPTTNSLTPNEVTNDAQPIASVNRFTQGAQPAESAAPEPAQPQSTKPLLDLKTGPGEVDANVGKLVDLQIGNSGSASKQRPGTQSAGNERVGNQNGGRLTGTRPNQSIAPVESTPIEPTESAPQTNGSAPNRFAQSRDVGEPQALTPVESQTAGTARAATVGAQLGSQRESVENVSHLAVPQRVAEAESIAPQAAEPLLGIEVGNGEVEANVGKLVDIQIGNGNRSAQNGDGNGNGNAGTQSAQGRSANAQGAGIQDGADDHARTINGENENSTTVPPRASSNPPTQSTSKSATLTEPTQAEPASTEPVRTETARTETERNEATQSATSPTQAKMQIGAQDTSSEIVDHAKNAFNVAEPESAASPSSAPQSAKSVIGLQIGNGEVEANVAQLADVRLGTANRNASQNGDGAARNQPIGNRTSPSPSTSLPIAMSETPPNKPASNEPVPHSSLPTESDTPGAARAATAAVELGTQPEAAETLDHRSASQTAQSESLAPKSLVGVQIGNGELEANVGNLVDVKLGNGDRSGTRNGTSGTGNPETGKQNVGNRDDEHFIDEKAPIAQSKSTTNAPPLQKTSEEPTPNEATSNELSANVPASTRSAESLQSADARGARTNSAASQSGARNDVGETVEHAVAPQSSLETQGLPQDTKPVVGVQIGHGEVEANVGRLVDVRLGSDGRAPIDNGHAGDGKPPRGEDDGGKSLGKNSNAPIREQSNEPMPNEPTPNESAPNEQIESTPSKFASRPVDTQTPGTVRAANAEAAAGSEHAPEFELASGASGKSLVGVQVGNGAIEANVGKLVDVQIGNAAQSGTSKSNVGSQPGNPNDESTPAQTPKPFVGVQAGNGEVELNVGKAIDVGVEGEREHGSPTGIGRTGNPNAPQLTETSQTTKPLIGVDVGRGEVNANVGHLVDVEVGVGERDGGSGRGGRTGASAPPAQPPSPDEPASASTPGEGEPTSSRSPATQAAAKSNPPDDASAHDGSANVAVDANAERGEVEVEANVGRFADINVGIDGSRNAPPGRQANVNVDMHDTHADVTVAPHDADVHVDLGENERLAVPTSSASESGEPHAGVSGDAQVNDAEGVGVTASASIRIGVPLPKAIDAPPVTIVTPEPSLVRRSSNAFTGLVQALFGRGSRSAPEPVLGASVESPPEAPSLDAPAAEALSTDDAAAAQAVAAEAVAAESAAAEAAAAAAQAREAAMPSAEAAAQAEAADLPAESEVAVATSTLDLAAMQRPAFADSEDAVLRGALLTNAQADGLLAPITANASAAAVSRLALELAAARDAAALAPGAVRALGQPGAEVASESLAALGARRGAAAPLSAAAASALDVGAAGARASAASVDADRPPRARTASESNPFVGGMVTVPLAFTSNGSDTRKRRPKLDFGSVEVDPELVLRYAEAIRSERPWTWRGIAGRFVLPHERAAVRGAAFEGDWLPAIAMDSDTGAADFAGAGLARHSDRLEVAVLEATSDAVEHADLESRVPADRLGAGLIWHRVDDRGTMQLIPASYHHAVRHAAARRGESAKVLRA